MKRINEEQNAKNEDSFEYGDHFEGNSFDCPNYDDMVDRMMEDTIFKSRKRKAKSSAKRNKRFKKGKLKK